MQKTGEKGYPPNARTSMLDVGGIRKGIDDAGNLDVCGESTWKRTSRTIYAQMAQGYPVEDMVESLPPALGIK